MRFVSFSTFKGAFGCGKDLVTTTDVSLRVHILPLAVLDGLFRPQLALVTAHQALPVLTLRHL